MAFTVCDTGEILLLKYILNHTDPSNMQLHLYKNDITPGNSDTLASFTESNAAGYTAVSLLGSAFTFATASGTSSASYASQTFTYTTSESVYGYYVTCNDTGGPQALIFAERFSSTFTLPGSGGNISISPVVKLRG